MKKTRMIAVLTALSTMTGSVLCSGLTASAADYNFTYEMAIYTNDTHENTVYIDSADLANGDYTFRAGIFIEDNGTLDLPIDMVENAWDGYDADGVDTGYIRFSNLSNASTKNDTMNRDFTLEGLNEDGTIGDSDITAYFVPSCFSYLAKRGDEAYLTSSWVSYANPYEHLTGSTLYSAGENKISFTDDDGVEYIANMIYDEKTGIATSVESFAINDTPDTSAEPIVINDYDPTLPAGEPIPSQCTNSCIIDLGQLDYVTEWFQGKSDAYAVTSFDVTIDANTPEGVYYVGFDSAKKNQNAMHGYKMNENSCTPVTIYPENIAHEQQIIKEEPFDMSVLDLDDCTPEEREELLEFYKDKTHKIWDDVCTKNSTENWLEIVVRSSDETTQTPMVANKPAPVDASQATLCGDVNLDSKIDLTDTILIGKTVAGSVTLSPAQVANADVDGNGSIETADTVMLMQFLMHVIDSIG